MIIMNVAKFFKLHALSSFVKHYNPRRREFFMDRLKSRFMDLKWGRGGGEGCHLKKLTAQETRTQSAIYKNGHLLDIMEE